MPEPGRPNILEDTKYNRVKVCLKRIRTQIPHLPEAKLIFAILERAAMDTYAETMTERNAAYQFLYGEMDVLKPLGLDPDYIRRVFREALVI